MIPITMDVLTPPGCAWRLTDSDEYPPEQWLLEVDGRGVYYLSPDLLKYAWDMPLVLAMIYHDLGLASFPEDGRWPTA